MASQRHTQAAPNIARPSRGLRPRGVRRHRRAVPEALVEGLDPSAATVNPSSLGSGN